MTKYVPVDRIDAAITSQHQRWVEKGEDVCICYAPLIDYSPIDGIPGSHKQVNFAGCSLELQLQFMADGWCPAIEYLHPASWDYQQQGVSPIKLPMSCYQSQFCVLNTSHDGTLMHIGR